MMKCLRKAGVQIEALIEYVKLFQEGEHTAKARKDILIEQRNLLMNRIEDMQQSLERLNYKIDRYDTVILPTLEKLKNSDKK